MILCIYDTEFSDGLNTDNLVNCVSAFNNGLLKIYINICLYIYAETCSIYVLSLYLLSLVSLYLLSLVSLHSYRRSVVSLHSYRRSLVSLHSYRRYPKIDQVQIFSYLMTMNKKEFKNNILSWKLENIINIQYWDMYTLTRILQLLQKSIIYMYIHFDIYMY